MKYFTFILLSFVNDELKSCWRKAKKKNLLVFNCSYTFVVTRWPPHTKAACGASKSKTRQQQKKKRWNKIQQTAPVFLAKRPDISSIAVTPLDIAFFSSKGSIAQTHGAEEQYPPWLNKHFIDWSCHRTLSQKEAVATVSSCAHLPWITDVNCAWYIHHIARKYIQQRNI